jgi:HSP20 family protein
MFEKKESLTPARRTHDPFALIRQMTTELDRMFDDWSLTRSPFGRFTSEDATGWSPTVDVVEKDNRLVTRVDLPGVKKEDVKVEVTDGHLAVSGERKRESEEKKDNFYRCEREFGSFYRAVPLPEGVKLEDVKATFADGVLEISVPLPPTPRSSVRKVEIEEPKKAAKTAA